MLFTSFEFILGFLPATFAIFFILARLRQSLAAAFLAFASLVFYGWWEPRFLGLLLASAGFNYLMGRQIAIRDSSATGKTLLAFAIAVNLTVLAVFKYADFAAETVNTLAGQPLLPLLHIVLPLGISFFTFTQIAFLVDCHRGVAREFNFVHYLLFVSYFPHLIAGPVLHHKQMMPQFGLAKNYRPRLENIALGTSFFVIGLAKKVLLADSFAEYSTPIFDATRDGATPSAFVAWSGALAYTFQIYFDFSGYSDMAVGLSKMFGIDLPLNFNSPYKSLNIIDFWRRWHMTLSQFLRDYLYIALGGNRHGRIRRYVNLLTTMLLGGLWHGANWTFVVWGALHGIYLVMNHAWQAVASRSPFSGGLVGRAAGVLLTFIAVIVAWVFFRAESLDSATTMLGSMFGLSAAPAQGSTFSAVFAGYAVPPDSLEYLGGLMSLGLAVAWLLPNSQELVETYRAAIIRNSASIVGSATVLVLLIAAINATRGVSEFIYFNF